MMERALVELPPNTVQVKDGKVVEIKRWVDWNGEPYPIIIVEREEDGRFSSSIGDPEHGGGSQMGPRVEDVVKELHPDVRRPYVEAFDAVDPTEEELLKLFPRFVINMG